MTTTPNDKNIDTAALSAEMDELSNELDPCDVATVLLMMHDADDPAIPFGEFIRTNRLAVDIIAWSQSNPDKAHAALERIAQIEEILGSL